MLTTSVNHLGISLKPNFRKERKEQRALQKVYKPSLYLNSITLEFCCKLSHNHGVFSFGNNKKPHGRYLYVRTLSGEIFIAKEGHIGHHSYLSNGKKVLSAGYFVFENGKMILVSNESGHYTPTNDEMLAELHHYYNLAKNDDLIYEDHSSVPSKKEIKHYRVREILEKTHIENVKPINIFKRQSNYGKELIEEETTPAAATDSTRSTSKDPAQNLNKKPRYYPDYLLGTNSLKQREHPGYHLHHLLEKISGKQAQKDLSSSFFKEKNNRNTNNIKPREVSSNYLTDFVLFSTNLPIKNPEGTTALEKDLPNKLISFEPIISITK